MLKCFDLSGKVAFVTGASRGLGKSFAKALAGSGADLFCTARSELLLKETCAELAREYGVHCAYAVMEITEEADVNRAVSLCMEQYGKIDILVNNAATDRINIPPEDTTVEQWKQVIDINVNGAFIVAHAVGKVMIKQGYGKIINLASICGTVLNKGVHGGAYDVSKLAVVGLTRTLGVEWAKYNINVNAIAPGTFLTDPNTAVFEEFPDLYDRFVSGIPAGRFGEPDELGPLAVFLASSGSDFMQGSVVTIDGGCTIW